MPHANIVYTAPLTQYEAVTVILDRTDRAMIASEIEKYGEEHGIWNLLKNGTKRVEKFSEGINGSVREMCKWGQVELIPNTKPFQFKLNRNDPKIMSRMVKLYGIDYLTKAAPETRNAAPSTVSTAPQVELAEPVDSYIEPLKIYDTKFFVRGNVETSLAGLAIREIVQNGCEAPLAPGRTATRIYMQTYFPETGGYAPKLVITNTAQGMDENELIAMMQFARSTKKMGLGATDNRGEGAKLSCLAFNKLGMEYLSRKGDGPILRIVMKFDGVEFGCVRSHVGNNKFSYVTEHDDEARPDLTDLLPSSGDFTSVIFWGNTKEHDTARDPYRADSTRKKIAPMEVFSRYYRLPDHVTLLTDTYVSARDKNADRTRALMVQAEIVAKYDSEFQHQTVTVNDNLKIEYVHLPDRMTKEGKVVGWSRYNESCGSYGARMGLVWNNEIYDAHEAMQWRHASAAYALGPVSNKVGVFIHVTGDYRPDRFRKDLHTQHNTKLTCADFLQEIVENRPQWLKTMVEDQFGPANTGTTRKRLQEMIKRWYERQSQSGLLNIASAGGLVATAPKVRVERVSPEQPGVINPKPPRPPKEDPLNGRVSGGRPNGEGQSMAVAPDFVWTNAKSIPPLEGRGAYYSRSENKIFCNEDYSETLSLIAEIKALVFRLSPNIGLDDLETIAKQAVRLHAEYAVGVYVVRQSMKNGNKHWPDADIEETLKTSSLSGQIDACHDDCQQIVAAIKKDARYRFCAATGSFSMDERILEEPVEAAFVPHEVSAADLIVFPN